jgi:hypothetical protein
MDHIVALSHAHQYPSRQRHFSPNNIRQRLHEYRCVPYHHLHHYTGQWVRYFRDGRFRVGGYLTQVRDEESEGSYACFKNGHVRWCAPAHCEFWVPDVSTRGQQRSPALKVELEREQDSETHSSEE